MASAAKREQTALKGLVKLELAVNGAMFESLKKTLTATVRIARASAPRQSKEARAKNAKKHGEYRHPLSSAKGLKGWVRKATKKRNARARIGVRSLPGMMMEGGVKPHMAGPGRKVRHPGHGAKGRRTPFIASAIEKTAPGIGRELKSQLNRPIK